ncbi:MAG: hypothetical protein ACRESZ_12450 [Methylococcales bacterium]
MSIYESTTKKLGALKQAEFCLGELTILCGGNNTWKTYATYALFGFLKVWKENLSVHIQDKKIIQLLSDGVVHIDVAEYSNKGATILADGCASYTRKLPMIFAASDERFKESQFSVSIPGEGFYASGKFERVMRAANAELFSITKEDAGSDLVITLLVDKDHDKPRLKKITQEERYKSEELISHDKLRVYIAEEALIKLGGGQRKTRCLTFMPAIIDPETGIEARSFDTTIEAMNRIQEEIVWGGE